MIVIPLDADTELIHNSYITEVGLNGRRLICIIACNSVSSIRFQTSRSLGALLAQLDFLFAKNGFWHASLSLEQLLHQLLPSAAGP